MPEPTIRYWQRVNYPGRMQFTRSELPQHRAAEAALERDPLWREVTVSPVVSDDVIEEAWGIVYDEAARYMPDPSNSELQRGISEGVAALAARGLLVGEDPEPGMLHRRFDGGRGTVLDDTGRVVGYLAGPRTVTDEQREAMREQIAVALADDWNPNRDPVLTAMFRDYGVTAADAALAELGLTVEGES